MPKQFQFPPPITTATAAGVPQKLTFPVVWYKWFHDVATTLGAGTTTTLVPVTGTFTATLIGVSGTHTGNMAYYVLDKMCYVWLTGGSLLGITSGGGFGFTGLPAACQPATYHEVPALLINNNVFATGWCVFNAGGTVLCDLPGGVAPAAGVGLGLGWSVTYPLL